jgi:hypothetical protein
MKNPQAGLSEEKARKELRLFLVIGWVLIIAAITIFGWAAIASFAFGFRSVLLSWHEGNARKANGNVLKAASIVLVVISGLALVGIYGQRMR